MSTLKRAIGGFLSGIGQGLQAQNEMAWRERQQEIMWQREEARQNLREQMAMRSDAAKAAADKQERFRKTLGGIAISSLKPDEFDKRIDLISEEFPEAAQYKGKFSSDLRASLAANAGMTNDLRDIRVVPAGAGLYDINANDALPGGTSQSLAEADGSAALGPQPDGTAIIRPEDVEPTRKALGGEAAFQAWMKKNNIRIGGTTPAPPNRQKLEADAAEAIRLGADPAAVQAELNRMLGAH